MHEYSTYSNSYSLPENSYHSHWTKTELHRDHGYYSPQKSEHGQWRNKSNSYFEHWNHYPNERDSNYHERSWDTGHHSPLSDRRKSSWANPPIPKLVIRKDLWSLDEEMPRGRHLGTLHSPRSPLSYRGRGFDSRHFSYNRGMRSWNKFDRSSSQASRGHLDERGSRVSIEKSQTKGSHRVKDTGRDTSEENYPEGGNHLERDDHLLKKEKLEKSEAGDKVQGLKEALPFNRHGVNFKLNRNKKPSDLKSKTKSLLGSQKSTSSFMGKNNHENPADSVPILVIKGVDPIDANNHTSILGSMSSKLVHRTSSSNLFERCLYRGYRIPPLTENKDILSVLRKKYPDLKNLFARTMKLCLKRVVPDRGSNSLTHQVQKKNTQLNESTCENLSVDPRVMSLSRTLQVDDKGNNSLQKIFKSCAHRSIKSGGTPSTSIKSVSKVSGVDLAKLKLKLKGVRLPEIKSGGTPSTSIKSVSKVSGVDLAKLKLKLKGVRLPEIFPKKKKHSKGHGHIHKGPKQGSSRHLEQSDTTAIRDPNVAGVRLDEETSEAVVQSQPYLDNEVQSEVVEVVPFSSEEVVIDHECNSSVVSNSAFSQVVPIHVDSVDFSGSSTISTPSISPVSLVSKLSNTKEDVTYRRVSGSHESSLSPPVLEQVTEKEEQRSSSYVIKKHEDIADNSGAGSVGKSTEDRSCGSDVVEESSDSFRVVEESSSCIEETFVDVPLATDGDGGGIAQEPEEEEEEVCLDQPEIEWVNDEEMTCDGQMYVYTEEFDQQAEMETFIIVQGESDPSGESTYAEGDQHNADQNGCGVDISEIQGQPLLGVSGTDRVVVTMTENLNEREPQEVMLQTSTSVSSTEVTEQAKEPIHSSHLYTDFVPSPQNCVEIKAYDSPCSKEMIQVPESNESVFPLALYKTESCRLDKTPIMSVPDSSGDKKEIDNREVRAGSVDSHDSDATYIYSETSEDNYELLVEESELARKVALANATAGEPITMKELSSSRGVGPFIHPDTLGLPTFKSVRLDRKQQRRKVVRSPHNRNKGKSSEEEVLTDVSSDGKVENKKMIVKRKKIVKKHGQDFGAKRRKGPKLRKGISKSVVGDRTRSQRKNVASEKLCKRNTKNSRNTIFKVFNTRNKIKELARKGDGKHIPRFPGNIKKRPVGGLPSSKAEEIYQFSGSDNEKNNKSLVKKVGRKFPSRISRRRASRSSSVVAGTIKVKEEEEGALSDPSPPDAKIDLGRRMRRRRLTKRRLQMLQRKWMKSQEYDDLPTILPPKRRRRNHPVSPSQNKDTEEEGRMERIMAEFPKHNWLMNKYHSGDSSSEEISSGPKILCPPKLKEKRDSPGKGLDLSIQKPLVRNEVHKDDDDDSDRENSLQIDESQPVDVSELPEGLFNQESRTEKIQEEGRNNQRGLVASSEVDSGHQETAGISELDTCQHGSSKLVIVEKDAGHQESTPAGIGEVDLSNKAFTHAVVGEVNPIHQKSTSAVADEEEPCHQESTHAIIDEVRPVHQESTVAIVEEAKSSHQDPVCGVVGEFDPSQQEYVLEMIEMNPSQQESTGMLVGDLNSGQEKSMCGVVSEGSPCQQESVSHVIGEVSLSLQGDSSSETEKAEDSTVNKDREEHFQKEPEKEDSSILPMEVDGVEYSAERPEKVTDQTGTTGTSTGDKHQPLDLCVKKPDIPLVNFRPCRQRTNPPPVQLVHPQVHKPPVPTPPPPATPENQQLLADTKAALNNIVVDDVPDLCSIIPGPELPGNILNSETEEDSPLALNLTVCVQNSSKPCGKTNIPPVPALVPISVVNDTVKQLITFSSNTITTSSITTSSPSLATASPSIVTTSSSVANAVPKPDLAQHSPQTAQQLQTVSLQPFQSQEIIPDPMQSQICTVSSQGNISNSSLQAESLVAQNAGLPSNTETVCRTDTSVVSVPPLSDPSAAGAGQALQKSEETISPEKNTSETTPVNFSQQYVLLPDKNSEHISNTASQSEGDSVQVPFRDAFSINNRHEREEPMDVSNSAIDGETLESRGQDMAHSDLTEQQLKELSEIEKLEKRLEEMEKEKERIKAQLVKQKEMALAKMRQTPRTISEESSKVSGREVIVISDSSPTPSVNFMQVQALTHQKTNIPSTLSAQVCTQSDTEMQTLVAVSQTKSSVPYQVSVSEGTRTVQPSLMESNMKISKMLPLAENSADKQSASLEMTVATGNQPQQQMGRNFMQGSHNNSQPNEENVEQHPINFSVNTSNEIPKLINLKMLEAQRKGQFISPRGIIYNDIPSAHINHALPKTKRPTQPEPAHNIRVSMKRLLRRIDWAMQFVKPVESNTGPFILRSQPNRTSPRNFGYPVKPSNVQENLVRAHIQPPFNIAGRLIVPLTCTSRKARKRERSSSRDSFTGASSMPCTPTDARTSFPPRASSASEVISNDRFRVSPVGDAVGSLARSDKIMSPQSAPVSKDHIPPRLLSPIKAHGEYRGKSSSTQIITTQVLRPPMSCPEVKQHVTARNEENIVDLTTEPVLRSNMETTRPDTELVIQRELQLAMAKRQRLESGQIEPNARSHPTQHEVPRQVIQRQNIGQGNTSIPLHQTPSTNPQVQNRGHQMTRPYLGQQALHMMPSPTGEGEYPPNVTLVELGGGQQFSNFMHGQTAQGDNTSISHSGAVGIVQQGFQTRPRLQQPGLRVITSSPGSRMPVPYQHNQQQQQQPMRQYPVSSVRMLGSSTVPLSSQPGQQRMVRQPQVAQSQFRPEYRQLTPQQQQILAQRQVQQKLAMNQGGMVRGMVHGQEYRRQQPPAESTGQQPRYIQPNAGIPLQQQPQKQMYQKPPIQQSQHPHQMLHPSQAPAHQISPQAHNFSPQSSHSAHSAGISPGRPGYQMQSAPQRRYHIGSEPQQTPGYTQQQTPPMHNIVTMPEAHQQQQISPMQGVQTYRNNPNIQAQATEAQPSPNITLQHQQQGLTLPVTQPVNQMQTSALTNRMNPTGQSVAQSVLSPPTPTSGMQNTASSTTPLQQVNGKCIMCGKVSLYLCSNCKRMWYCSQECQLSHWTTHAQECKAVGM